MRNIKLANSRLILEKLAKKKHKAYNKEMTKKSLQSWYNDGEINYNQKEIIKKFGVGDYHPEHALWDLKKLWYLFRK